MTLRCWLLGHRWVIKRLDCGIGNALLFTCVRCSFEQHVEGEEFELLGMKMIKYQEPR